MSSFLKNKKNREKIHNKILRNSWGKFLDNREAKQFDQGLSLEKPYAPSKVGIK